MTTHEIKEEVLKVAPPAGVSALSICGICLSDWVYLATLLYLALQITWLVFRFYGYCRRPK